MHPPNGDFLIVLGLQIWININSEYIFSYENIFTDFLNHFMKNKSILSNARKKASAQSPRTWPTCPTSEAWQSFFLQQRGLIAVGNCKGDEWQYLKQLKQYLFHNCGCLDTFK